MQQRQGTLDSPTDESTSTLDEKLNFIYFVERVEEVIVQNYLKLNNFRGTCSLFLIRNMSHFPFKTLNIVV